MASYFLAKVASGKDTSYTPFEGNCGRCHKAPALSKGVGIKTPNRRLKRLGKAHSWDELVVLFDKFAQMEAKDWSKRMGKDIEPDDNVVKFIVQRTDGCPHQFITPLSRYWIETSALMDGEMGFCFDRRIEELPSYFFDAIGVIREARNKANREDREIGKSKHSNQNHGR